MQTAPLKMWQKETVIELLETFDGTNAEKIIHHITQDAKIAAEQAKTFLEEWRSNPKGPINRMRKAVDAFRRSQIRDANPQKKRKDPSTGNGPVGKILQLHKSGKSNQEIIQEGFNKSTVYRQVLHYKRLRSQGQL